MRSNADMSTWLHRGAICLEVERRQEGRARLFRRSRHESIILKWLQTELGAEVVTFTADLGQGDAERSRAGAQEGRDDGHQGDLHPDVREEFVKDFVFPMFRANAVYEGTYLLGTSIARPLISKHLVEIAARPAPTPSPTAPPARATTRCASSCPPMRSTPTSRSSRPGATGTSSRAPT
jgi:hypothetical protein